MTNGENSWGISFGRIMFLDQILRSHDNMSQVDRRDDLIFEVTRKKQKDELVIFCGDSYAFSETQVRRVLEEFEEIDVIYVGGKWNGYTKEAKDLCDKKGIGIFNAGEINGALWKDDAASYYRVDEDGDPDYAFKTG